MKAYTVYQPYAYATVAGIKHYETRPRRTSIRGRVAVHAAKKRCKPKVVLCRLHMAGKTIQQIREECAGQGMTYRDFENIQRANEFFDGVRCRLSLWEWDHYESYHLDDWDAPDDERMMMAIYYSEQVHPVPRYKNDLEKFKADWAAGTYDPGGVICFHPRDVEEIEVISEEVKPPKPDPAPRHTESAKPRRRKKKKKGGKRK